MNKLKTNKIYPMETVTLVRLAKKTKNMPMLMFTIEQLKKFREKYPVNFYHETTPVITKKQKITDTLVIQSLYKTVTEDETLQGKKLENNFVRIMDNWKEFKRRYVTN